uniref:Uncharacterized protein n=1 Tax=Romanomermis culicivorax TaxID=13658 RepID=A0A915J6P2_ROMCU
MLVIRALGSLAEELLASLRDALQDWTFKPMGRKNFKEMKFQVPDGCLVIRLENSEDNSLIEKRFVYSDFDFLSVKVDEMAPLFGYIA